MSERTWKMICGFYALVVVLGVWTMGPRTCAILFYGFSLASVRGLCMVRRRMADPRWAGSEYYGPHALDDLRFLRLSAWMHGGLVVVLLMADAVMEYAMSWWVYAISVVLYLLTWLYFSKRDYTSMRTMEHVHQPGDIIE